MVNIKTQTKLIGYEILALREKTNITLTVVYWEKFRNIVLCFFYDLNMNTNRPQQYDNKNVQI